MDATAVAVYLKENPQFFEEYADSLAEIFVPHPHGGHAIPIAERQIITLREKNQELAARFKELVAYGTENDQIGEKMHRSTLALFAAPDLETTLAVLYHSLREISTYHRWRRVYGGRSRSNRTCPSLRRPRPKSADTPTC